MIAFLKRRKTLAFVIFVLVIWLSGFMFWSEEMTDPPLDEPILLSPAGSVERNIRVRMEGPHELRFVFSIGTRPRDEAMRLIGDYSEFGTDGLRKRSSGTNVPLRWSLTDPSGRPLATGDGDTYGSDGYAETRIWRAVKPPIRVEPGTYRLNASLMRDIPELDGMTARLQFALPGGKRSFGWRSDLLFWGQLANLFVVGPLAVLLTIVLMGLSFAHWIASRRS